MPELNKNQLKQFYNCRILRQGKISVEDLWVRNGRIIDPEKIFYDEKVEPEFKVNCQGAIISPGFIDVQINGILKCLVTIGNIRCLYKLNHLIYFLCNRWFWH